MRWIEEEQSTGGLLQGTLWFLSPRYALGDKKEQDGLEGKRLLEKWERTPPDEPLSTI
jgi:hypothetical protein